LDSTPPGPKVERMYKPLSRAEASTLTQLRTSHIGLNAHLYRTRTIDSPLCRRCGVPETVTHFIMSCRRFSAEHDAL
ncbi:hypothetical protein BDZ89DRAFT_894472, partial [Hymenopellis radicata]